jgi:hypothetical protein
MRFTRGSDDGAGRVCVGRAGNMATVPDAAWRFSGR